MSMDTLRGERVREAFEETDKARLPQPSNPPKLADPQYARSLNLGHSLTAACLDSDKYDRQQGAVLCVVSTEDTILFS